MRDTETTLCVKLANNSGGRETCLHKSAKNLALVGEKACIVELQAHGSTARKAAKYNLGIAPFLALQVLTQGRNGMVLPPEPLLRPCHLPLHQR